MTNRNLNPEAYAEAQAEAKAERRIERFDAWMRKVDTSCRKLSGVKLNDLGEGLEDEDFHRMFINNYTPVAAARSALTEVGF